MAHVIALSNQKGGVGKTTTAINLSAALARLGQRVLLVDLDPQYSATQWMDISDVGRGVFDLLADPENTPTESLIRSTPCENVSIIPSSSWLVGAEKAMAGEPGAEQCLREKLGELADKPFDYILIDCPPSLNMLTINALVAADSSSLYARNVLDFLKLVITKEGALHVPMDDDIVVACLMAQGGEVKRK